MTDSPFVALKARVRRYRRNARQSVSRFAAGCLGLAGVLGAIWLGGGFGP